MQPDYLHLAILPLVNTIGIPLLFGLAWRGLSILQRHGYQTTYAAAILRAAGAGQEAATLAGVSIFSPAGKALAVKAGTDYLMNTVAGPGAKLGITTEADHALRVSAQLGVMELQRAVPSAQGAPAIALAAGAERIETGLIDRVAAALSPGPAEARP